MRPLPLALIGGAALMWSCVGAVNVADDARGRETSLVAATAPILLEEGGVMRPIANGGRVPLRQGWATVRFDRIPIASETRLVVTLFDASGAMADGEVTAEYEAVGMDHGRTTARSTPDGASRRLRLSFEMPGQWRVAVRIARGGAQETFTLVLPTVGL